GVAGFERLVAIKCCHPDLCDDKDFAAMFLDEARLAARIHHPNVVATFDAGADGSALYMAMEYVDGASLSGVMRTAASLGEPVPVAVALGVIIDVLTGLHAAHELVDPEGRPLHLVHRDVSPQNILVGVDGVARITDFGIAKAESRNTVTHDGRLK